MDFESSMNRILSYIEEHLTDDIDCAVLTGMLPCSEWEFRRYFSAIAQIPLSEYIRRRRLTAASEHIRNGEKIIDVSLRYGYDSPAAFSRAFRNFHGISPSKAREKDAVLREYKPLTVKMILTKENDAKKMGERRINIIGSGQVSYGISTEPDSSEIHRKNQTYWDFIGNDAIGNTCLPKYGAFLSEETCNLFGDVSQKKLLEIACGTGQSLYYHAERGASELWGIDISPQQIEKAKAFLETRSTPARLICSSMESDCGIPTEYFDYVYSIYGIGWAVDLNETFRRICSYLKKDGVFIFSWSHPIHKCVSYEYDTLIFRKSYFDEAWYSVPLGGGYFSLCDRKLSTYINALAKAGFIIEQLVEESDQTFLRQNPDSNFAKKASMLPATFVIKARKA